MFFDHGAQRTFVAHALAQKLNLPVLREMRNVRVCSFADEVSIPTYEVKLDICTQDGQRFSIRATVIPTLKKVRIQQRPLPSVDMGFLSNHISAPCLATDAYCTKEFTVIPDLMIGSDYLGKIIDYPKTPHRWKGT